MASITDRGIPSLPTRGNGAFKLFHIAGITVRLHWTWFLLAYYRINGNTGYHSQNWSVAEYLAIFLIVLLHEFGHALACRQTGGTANEIILWPLGGVAYVSPPPRAGAYLWSIAAGPLVNVLLLPVFFGFHYLVSDGVIGPVSRDMLHFSYMILLINTGLLCFNLLPVYPLDGGQIVRALLWFLIGPIRSLLVSSVIGIVSVIALFIYVVTANLGWWPMILCLFILLRCVAGFKQARAMARALAQAQAQANLPQPEF